MFPFLFLHKSLGVLIAYHPSPIKKHHQVCHNDCSSHHQLLLLDGKIYVRRPQGVHIFAWGKSGPSSSKSTKSSNHQKRETNKVNGGASYGEVDVNNGESNNKLASLMEVGKWNDTSGLTE